MIYLLCKHCLARHRKNKFAKAAKADAECFICQGALGKLESMADAALNVAKEQGFSFNSFAVQSSFPRPMMVREEELFDNEPLADAMAIKNQANRLITDYLIGVTKKKCTSANAADIVFKLDFWHNKSAATPTSVFVFARYRKLSRNYCQHEWRCGACRGRGCRKCEGKGENYPSVEGAIKSAFAPAFKASDVMLHASGREDVDVMMEGNGRPCVIEIIHPGKRDADLEEIAGQIAKAHPIRLSDLRICNSSWVGAVCTSHFEKKYRVWVEASRGIGKEELGQLLARVPIMLNQRTPVRVSQRRSDLVRQRRVLAMQLIEHNGKSFVLDLKTDAGTYIKEFVHGDGGRTVPSIGSLLSCQAECKQLNVVHIYDEFIDSLG